MCLLAPSHGRVKLQPKDTEEISHGSEVDLINSSKVFSHVVNP